MLLIPLPALRSLAPHSLCPPEDGQAAISAELRRAKRLLLLDDFRPNLATPMTMTERRQKKDTNRKEIVDKSDLPREGQSGHAVAARAEFGREK